MEFIIRIFALLLIAAAAAAAANTPKNTQPTTSHQSATVSLPGPVCDPTICPTGP